MPRSKVWSSGSANSRYRLQVADPNRGRVAVITVFEPLAYGLIDHESGTVEVPTVPSGRFEDRENPAFPSAVMNPMFTHT